MLTSACAGLRVWSPLAVSSHWASAEPRRTWRLTVTGLRLSLTRLAPTRVTGKMGDEDLANLPLGKAGEWKWVPRMLGAEEQTPYLEMTV